MSSDMYSCASCMKYKNVFDMHKSESGKMVCKECSSKYGASYFPGATVSDLSDGRNITPPSTGMPPMRRVAITNNADCPEDCTHRDMLKKMAGQLVESNWDGVEMEWNCPTHYQKLSSDLSPNIAPVGGPGSDHYTINKITPMEYVKGMGRDEYRGACILNIIKYISRAPHKGTEMEDLEKAKWYIEQMIAVQKEWNSEDWKNR